MVKSTVTIVTDAESLGSGFYVLPNVIATNYHVMEGATSAKCVVANTNISVKVLGYVAVDKDVDLVLLKVSGKPRTPLKMATGNVSTGQIIYAIGAPQGMTGTISDGIVSAIRKVEGVNLVQITAPISQGSSGGPVVNRVGKVVGISTLIHTGGQNLNFAVAYTHLQALMQQMQAKPKKLALLNRQRPSSQATQASGASANEDIVKLRSTECSLRYKVDGRWNKWSAWEDASVLIVIDGGKERVSIYSAEEQVYDIIDTEEERTDEDGDDVLSLFCVDKDGKKCGVRLVAIRGSNERLQLYVNYSDMSWVYNVYALD
ncbi:MAG: serine protease [Prevotellaceae bacterium]|nr:serine protease [Prevotellaceae bacterium]